MTIPEPPGIQHEGQSPLPGYVSLGTPPELPQATGPLCQTPDFLV